MNKRLFDALLSVSAASTGAKQLADKVMTESSPDLIKQLYAKIQYLESVVADLTSIVDVPESISDSEAKDLAVNLQRKMKDLDAASLHQLDRSYLRMYPKFVRSIVATELKNKAVELATYPLAEWLDVIALNGEIK